MTDTERTAALIAKLDSDVEAALNVLAAHPGVVNECLLKSARDARWYTLHVLVRLGHDLFPGHDTYTAAVRCDELRNEMLEPIRAEKEDASQPVCVECVTMGRQCRTHGWFARPETD